VARPRLARRHRRRLIRIIASHSGIDRTTACGRPGKRLQ
jgi:hypothetical protein